MATQAGYQFPSADDAGDLTDLQLLFFHYAELEQQKRFLEAIGEMFSD